MTRKVLHIGKFFPPDRGGMESFLAELILAQQSRGMEVVALVHGDPQPDDPAWLTRVPVQLRFVYTPIALGFRQAIKQAIDEFQPEIIHLHMPNVSVFWLLTLPAARHVPWVVHWHSDVIVSRLSPLPLRVAYMAYRPLEQAILEQSARIVATSETYLAVSEPLVRWRYKCSAVPLGIKLDAPEPSESFNSFEWSDGHLRVLTLGRLAYYKGFETLIQAVSKTEGVELVIAGDGEQKAKLQQLVDHCTPRQRLRIHLLGHVNDSEKHDLLKSCDVFCLASRERTEAFGVVLLEAMAHAKPCIVSNLEGSGMPWVVKVAGAGIHNLPVDEPQSWAQLLDYLQANRQQLQVWGQRGRAGLEKHFSIETCEQAIHGQYASSQLFGKVNLEYRIAQPDPVYQAESEEILIVIPVKNKAATISTHVSAIIAAGWRHVLVIDEQSDDRTGDLSRRAGASVIRPSLAAGGWGAIQLGICYGLAQGFHAVLTMDSTGPLETQEISLLLAQAGQADLVIGVQPQRMSRLRNIAWRWFRNLSGLGLEDPTSGFRYYSRRAMSILATPEASMIDDQNVGVLLLIRRAGLQIHEVPVRVNASQGRSADYFYPWVIALRYLLVSTLLSLTGWKQGFTGREPARDQKSV